MLQAWDYHPAGSVPFEGSLVMTIPAGYDKLCGDEPYAFKVIRYSSNKQSYVYRGYWTLTDEELLNLFKGEIPFRFIP